jgi:hypothetical protein
MNLDNVLNRKKGEHTQNVALALGSQQKSAAAGVSKQMQLHPAQPADQKHLAIQELNPVVNPNGQMTSVTNSNTMLPVNHVTIDKGTHRMFN